MFVEPSDQVYEGMVVGENARERGHRRQHHEGEEAHQHALVDVGGRASTCCRRASMSLEQALEWIRDDEMLEVTPKSLRLRKRTLGTGDRSRDARKG